MKLNQSILFVVFAVTLWFGAAFAAVEPPAPEPKSLEDELQSLSVPSNQAPSAVSSEQLYAVQSRLSPLGKRSEVTLSGAKNLTADSFLVSQEIDLGYRFYFSDRWFVGVSGSYVSNSLSGSGQRLLEESKRLPDVAYTKYRADLMAGYNLFYGKFRLTMDQVFYFDQYVALGPGVVVQDLGTHPAAVADIGFVFWFGRNFSFRFGVKDYLFQEERRLSQGIANNVMSHLDIGYVFGG